MGYKTLRLISLKRKIEVGFPIHIRMSMWDPYRTRKSVYELADRRGFRVKACSSLW